MWVRKSRGTKPHGPQHLVLTHLIPVTVQQEHYNRLHSHVTTHTRGRGQGVRHEGCLWARREGREVGALQASHGAFKSAYQNNNNVHRALGRGWSIRRAVRQTLTWRRDAGEPTIEKCYRCDGVTYRVPQDVHKQGDDGKGHEGDLHAPLDATLLKHHLKLQQAASSSSSSSSSSKERQSS
jgi:hypothetical protein